MVDTVTAPPRLTPQHVAQVALLTFVAYALVAAVALLLAGPPGYAAPLYPSAGIALAATLAYGRPALPGVLLGALVANAGLSALRGQVGWPVTPLPLTIGLGAMLQAWLGAALIRRQVQQPLVLDTPQDIVRAGALGAVVACTASASVATAALWLSGVLQRDQLLDNWTTWWVGDTLGVLIAAPLALTLIGRPAEDWRPRRMTVGLPLLAALAVLAVGVAQLGRVDRQRMQATFDRDAGLLAGTAQERLAAPLHALQALHGVARAQGGLGRDTLRDAAKWWLAQPLHLQGAGYSVRLEASDVPAFEAAARAEGLAGFRVFDRDEGRARTADGEVVALRHIEPATGNAGALGVNALSIPAARLAILATRDSGEPAATAGFRLTQAIGDETGVVLYQAVYRGRPETAAQRAEAFLGVVFVTVNAERALAGMAGPAQAYLQWCLSDPDPKSERQRLVASPGCLGIDARDYSLHQQTDLRLGGRRLVLQVAAQTEQVPGQMAQPAWLLSVIGLGAASLMGALLLTMTGQNRRTALAVQAATGELRREMVERDHAERALRESEARLRSILDHVPLGVVFLDPGGRIIECNPRLCTMLGRSAQALRGQVVTDLVHPEELERLQQQRLDLLSGQEVAVLGPLRFKSADGQDRLVRLSAAALRDGQSRVLRMVGVVEDVTEHLRLEASERALHRAEAANRAKSEFLSRMSHELRTPLNAMIGFTQLLDMDRDQRLSTQQHDWVQQVLRAGWHLLEMINETLDLARIESGAVKLALAPVELAPLVAACHGMVAASAQQRDIQVLVQLDAAAPAVQGDTTRVKQVLTNLLSNAIKYNRSGGSVTLSTRRIDGERVEIVVADTGLGMTTQQLGALFQPYNRLGREGSGIEGTGIGLVISRRLTELMGGTLQVQSQADQGSTFTLDLPAAVAPPPAAALAGAAATAPYRRRRVHYVEDNDTNIEVMRGVLAQREQIELETSTLGLDGLAAIRRRQPDLILLDMQLPDISGLELLRHLKQDDAAARIPVIVVSADATPAHMEQALTLGAAHYVTKPIDAQRFLALIDEILEGAVTRWGV